MNYNKVAQAILKSVGGSKNVDDAMHCFTRLRLYLKDKSLVDLESIKDIDGVIGVQFQNEQLQVIVGNDVSKVYTELEGMLEHLQSNTTPQSSSIIDSLMKTVSNIFTPILPAIIGAGLMKALIPLLVLSGLISQTGGTYNLLNIIADASFTFLPFLVAISSAKRFKVNEYLAVALAGALFYPTLSNPDIPISLLGIFSVPRINYAASVIPIILGVYTMSIIYKYVDKVIPGVVKMIFTPLITLLLSVPLLLFIFGPIGSTIGTYVAQLSVWLSMYVPLAYGLLIGAFYPFIIMTGMHYAFVPIMLENIAKLGFENGFLVMSVFSNLAMAGAVIAVIRHTKDKSMKEIAASSGISAIFGITEPALYGVATKLKSPLYATMITGAIVNAIVITLGLKMYTFVAPSILALTSFYGNNNDLTNLILAIIAAGISFILAYFISFILINKMKTKEPPLPTAKKITKSVYAPISGKVVPLKDVPDQTFADELMGKGCAIIPSTSNPVVVAPFDGVVKMLSPTKHAIGLISNDGIEVLIHVGLDTVYLNGEGFTLHVQEGDIIHLGNPLITCDATLMQSKNLDCITPIIILNSKAYLDVVTTDQEHVKQGEDRLLLIL